MRDDAEPDAGALAFQGDVNAVAGAVGDDRDERGPGRGALPLSSLFGPDVAGLVGAYRDRGFLRATLDPLGLTPTASVDAGDLDPAAHGLDIRRPRVKALRDVLHAAYCGPIGYEFGHIHDPMQRAFLSDFAEGRRSAAPDREAGLAALALAARSVAFETTLAQRLPGAKLFGLGGAESFNVLLERIIAACAAGRDGIRDVVVGGMHRGRFNMLANVFGKPLVRMLAEIKGAPPVPEGLGVSSDVSYHLGHDGDVPFGGETVRCSVSAHPSHLQLIPVISQGRARARQSRRGADGRKLVLPLLLHTDASFAGQGLVAEMLQLARLEPFDLGGTIHVVINNQLGFTTTPEEGRSARGCTDIARLIEAPVLHVNGDDLDAVQTVAGIAAAWRRAFARDILIDLVCYRRPGHNEIDEPRFTQPLMYRAIEARRL